MTQDLIEQGIQAFIASDRNRARKLLQAGLQQDPDNEQGWMGLSFLVGSPELELECLQHVLAINPQNEHAAKRMRELSATAPNPPSDEAGSTAAAPIPSSSEAGKTAEASFPALSAEPASRELESEALHTAGEFFLLRPENRGFVQGQTQQLPSPLGGLATGCVWAVVGLFMFGAVMGLVTVARNWIQYAASGGDSGLEPVSMLIGTGGALLFCLLPVSVAAVLLYAARRQKRLAAEGRMITGEIVGASGRRDSEGDFILTARVRFRSPQTRKWIERTYRPRRDDLERKPLPEPGTQVHVLYIDDRTHQAL
jgi:hypothetical protein